MPEAVPPPKADPLDYPDDPTPRDRRDLVYGLMEARDCSKPDAERFLEEHGDVHAERVLRARWSLDNYRAGDQS